MLQSSLHKNFGYQFNLQLFFVQDLSVSDEQVKGAISSLSQISYVNKLTLVDLHDSAKKETQEQEMEQ